MNKEQSADDPPWIWFKNMLNSTISMSYPDVVIACIEHKALKVCIVIEAALVKARHNMKDYSGMTDHHNC